MQPCDVCVRRARCAGGNGSCPVYSPPMVWIDNPRREIREPETLHWPKHKKLWPDGCTNFQRGDLRQRPEEELQQALEGQMTLG